MALAHKLQTLIGLGPKVAVEKIAAAVRRTVVARYREQAQRRLSTYPEPASHPLPAPLLPRLSLDRLDAISDPIRALTVRVMAHRFDVLGSGWTSVSYGAEAPGFDGRVYPARADAPEDPVGRLTPGNRPRAAKIRKLIDGGFRSIDWQRDPRSGYRWREDRLSAGLMYGHLPGADVKGPWELARLHHLPWLAWAFILAGAQPDGFMQREAYLREFRNQVLDFWAANPPGYGVNWMCAMDVAIRATNIVLAHDIFRAHGVGFDSGFSAELGSLLHAHGRHVVDNLEWSPRHRANHYLANVCGLAFIAAALPRTGQTDRWLAFSVQELIDETEHQFLPDGANFEASTSYHRLSAEMVTYATALVMGLPVERRAALKDYDHQAWTGKAPLHPGPFRLYTLPNGEATQGPFPPAHFRTLERMADFSAHITKPNGRVVQIGDNDSGRFLKLAPVLAPDAEAVREEHLSHRTLVGAVNGLFNRPDRADFAGPAGALEGHIVASLAKTALNSYREPGTQAAAAGRGIPFGDIPGAERNRPNRTITIRPPDPAVLEGLHLCRYADFGLYIFASRRLFLSVRCGPAAHDGRGAHAHNDQLAIELNIDGEDWLADPGSYTYTADVKARNAYRSVAAHAAPRRGKKEPSPLTLSPFRLPDRAKAECLGFEPGRFVGVHYGFGFPQVRTVTIEDGAIVIVDTPGATRRDEYASARTAAEAQALFGLDLPFSPGYGLRDPADGQDSEEGTDGR
jgi:hypothetical protein